MGKAAELLPCPPAPFTAESKASRAMSGAARWTRRDGVVPAVTTPAPGGGPGAGSRRASGRRRARDIAGRGGTDGRQRHQRPGVSPAPRGRP